MLDPREIMLEPREIKPELREIRLGRRELRLELLGIWLQLRGSSSRVAAASRNQIKTVPHLSGRGRGRRWLVVTQGAGAAGWVEWGWGGRLDANRVQGPTSITGGR